MLGGLGGVGAGIAVAIDFIHKGGRLPGGSAGAATTGGAPDTAPRSTEHASNTQNGDRAATARAVSEGSETATEK